MLARVNRLVGKNNFERIKKEGTFYQSDSFGVSFIKRSDMQPSRFGFIVSTKVSKDAPLRNKARRALREAVRQFLSYIKPGYDVVFLAKQTIIRRYTDDIMHEVRVSLGKMGLLK